MIKMTLIEAYNADSQFKNLAFLDLKNGDVIDWQYEFNLGAPHQLIVTIAPQFSRYEDVKNRKDIGIRLQTDTLDLAFVYFDICEKDYGTLELTLLSASYKLIHSPLEYKNQYYSGSLATLLSVYTDFAFVPISGDYTVEIPSTGGLKNLEVIQEAINYPDNTSWLEVGIRESGGVFKTYILYGDFRQIEAFYNANSSDYPELEPIEVRQLTNVDNDELNTAIINSYEIVENTIKFNHVYAYNDNGNGSSPNTIIELDPNGDYVDPQYPVVTIDGVNYVNVPQAAQHPIKIEIYPVSDPANTQNDANTQQTTPTLMARVAYRKTVSYIQSFQNTRWFKFDLTLKKLTLPGVPQKVRFKNTVYNDDKTILYTQDIDETTVSSQYSGNGNEIFN